MFDHYNMEFHPNKTSAKILREDSFGRTYFRNSYSSVNTNGMMIHWENLVIYWVTQI